MKKITLLALCVFFLSLLSSSAANLYLIGNTSSAWTTSAVTGFTVYKVDLSNSGTDGATVVSLTQWLNDRTGTPTYKIGGSGGSVGSSFSSTDNVWVAGGTYNVAIVWTIGNSPAKLFGGFAGNETVVTGRANGANPWDYTPETTINGSGSAAGIITAGAARTIIIDGLTFTGCTNTQGQAVYQRQGMTVQNCKFTSNSCVALRFYMGSTSSGSTSTTNCYFYNNTYTTSAGTEGGCILAQNNTTGGTYTISGCVFDSNSSTASGSGSTAGVKSIGATTTYISGCIFKNNKATAGGSSAISLTATVNTVTNCLIYGNLSDLGTVQALYMNAGTITNCSFINNYKGAYINASGSTTLNNCVFWGSATAPAYPGNISTAGTTANITLNNCAYITIGTVNANNSGIVLPTANNTGANAPVFVDPTTNNWQLGPGSSLIDNGTSVNAPSTDLLNVSRPQPTGGTYDIGAYEYVKTTPTITWSQALTGLKSSDGQVTLTASSSAGSYGANITYSSSDNTVVTVSGSTLTVTGVGSATVTAHQAGNTYFNSAIDVTQNVTVTQSIANSGFEDPVANFTVVESSTNALMRVGNIYDATTQTTYPTSSAISNANGLWVRKSSSTGYIKGVVVTSDQHSGSSSLNFKLTSGLTYSSATQLNIWNTALVSQKVSTLTNTNKYIISFWAKADGTSPNAITNVTAFVCDNTKRTYLSCAIPLTGGTTWTQYSAIFDVPSFKTANSTADFTTAYVGVGLTTTFDPTTFKTNYSGVLLDDFSVSATSTGTVSITTSAGTGGNVTGTGAVYVSGTSATVVAAPTLGYSFVNWTESGTQVSTSASYTFTASTNRTLVANFVATSVPISQSSLSGFNYNVGSGPSSEQSFTVGGTNLTSNIVITPPTDFEISTTSGNGFQSSAITLTASSGSVSTTTIYVRLKSGLAVNSYSSENITVAVMGSSQTVACSGSVSKITPTLSLATSSVNYTGSAQSATVNSSVAGAVSNVLYNSSATAPTAVGTYPVIADFVPTDGTNYNNLTGASAGTFTIAAISQTVSSSGSIGTDPLLPGTDITVNNGYELTVDNLSPTTVHSITVNPGGKLTLGSATLTATNGVTLQSNSSATATLVDNTISSPQAITGTVQQYLPQGRNWYVSSPVTEVTGNSSSLTAAGLATSVTYYNEKTGWVNDYSGPLTPGIGYIAVSSTGTGTNTAQFTGTLNSGDVTVTLTRQGSTFAGYNLVANPYPSYLNAMAAINNASPNIQTTIWYRTRSTGGTYYFETVNTASGEGTNAAGTGTVTGYVPPMQAFWVRTIADNQSLTFTNAMRYHANPTINSSTVTTTPLKAKAQTNTQRLRLQVSNGTNADETVIYTHPNASNAVDIYDSPKRSNNLASIPEIFSIAGTEQLVINGMNSIPFDTEIPLGFTTGQAGTNFSIKASQVSNFDPGTLVILKDYLDINNPVITDLSDGNSYVFSSDITTNNTSRFALVFKAPSGTTGINLNGNNDLWISTNNNGQIIINGNTNAGTTVDVYNAVGQKLSSSTLKSTISVLDKPLSPGVYMLTFTSAGKTQTKKVIVN